MRRQYLYRCWIVLVAVAALGATDAGPQFLQAAKDDDTAAVGELLKEGADVNASAGDGATALHWAAYRDNSELARLLIQAGASVNIANDLGVTPLWVAATTRSTATLETLLEAGANPNIVPPTGETPLMVATRTANVDGVRLLVAHGADVNAREAQKGQTALMWAASKQEPEIVRNLIEAGADLHARTVTSQRYVLLCCQEYNGDIRPGTAWVRHGGFTPLLFAAREGALESARLMLEAGANLDDTAADGASALGLAALSGQGAVATLLVEAGADVNAAGAGYTALHAAVMRGDLALAKSLIAYGANLNARLTEATQARRNHNDYAFDKALLGATPFMLAAKEGEAEFMRSFAAAGADLSLPLVDGSTPLMVAALGKQRVRPGRTLIVVAGQDVNREPERRALEAVKVVVELGAVMDANNDAGDTALHVAAQKRFETVTRFLAENRADLHARNARGRTPLGEALTPLSPPPGTQVAVAGLVVIDEGPKIARTLRDLGALE